MTGKGFFCFFVSLLLWFISEVVNLDENPETLVLLRWRASVSDWSLRSCLDTQAQPGQRLDYRQQLQVFCPLSKRILVSHLGEEEAIPLGELSLWPCSLDDVIPGREVWRCVGALKGLREVRRFVGVSSSNMKSPERRESVTLPPFISLYDNCGTAGAAPLADPSHVLSCILLTRTKLWEGPISLKYGTGPLGSPGSARSCQPSRWSATSDMCFMSNAYEPTARRVNGLSSSIWTSRNCTLSV